MLMHKNIINFSLKYVFVYLFEMIEKQIKFFYIFRNNDFNSNKLSGK